MSQLTFHLPKNMNHLLRESGHMCETQLVANCQAVQGWQSQETLEFLEQSFLLVG